MTLILTTLTPDYIIQASDRRVTLLPSGKVRNDDEIKAVMWEQVLFANTGLANLPRSDFYIKNNKNKDADIAKKSIPTSQWLAELLSVLPENSLDLIAEEATNAIRNIVEEYPDMPENYLALFFIGAYWQREEGVESLKPYLISIDNKENRLQLSVSKLGLGAAPLFIHTSRNIRKLAHQVATRNLRKLARNNQLSANNIARLMLDLIREEASYNSDIGKSVNITCIPRKVIEDFDSGIQIKINIGNINNKEIKFMLFEEEDTFTQGKNSSVRLSGSNFSARTINLLGTGSLIINPTFKKSK